MKFVCQKMFFCNFSQTAIIWSHLKNKTKDSKNWATRATLKFSCLSEYFKLIYKWAETVNRRCFCEIAFKNISQIFEENTCTRVSILLSLQAVHAEGLQLCPKEISPQVCSCVFFKNFKNIFLTKNFRTLLLNEEK